jgi:N4-gp56 family major capsid protein
MADAYTQVSSISNLVQTAYDKMVEQQNRHAVLLRMLPDKTVADPTSAGSSYTLQKYNDLAESSAELTELVDPDAVAIPQTTTLNVAYREFGRVVFRSHKLDLTSMTQVDPIIVDVLARDQAVSLDNEIKTIVNAGTNVTYAGTATSTATVTAAMTIDAQDVRIVRTKLRKRAASPRRGELYWCGLHPNVSYDLRSETGAGSWQDLHKYGSAPEVFWPGEIGVFEGVYFVENARMKVAADGATGANVYRTLFAGRQALAEVVWEEPRTVIADIPVDKLQRHRPFGWRGALNWAIYRDENLERLESGSSIATP